MDLWSAIAAAVLGLLLAWVLLSVMLSERIPSISVHVEEGLITANIKSTQILIERVKCIIQTLFGCAAEAKDVISNNKLSRAHHCPNLNTDRDNGPDNHIFCYDPGNMQSLGEMAADSAEQVMYAICGLLSVELTQSLPSTGAHRYPRKLNGQARLQRWAQANGPAP